MRKLSASLLAVCAALLAWFPFTARARPYALDDLLKTEGFGQIVVAPGGRWLIFERRVSREGRAQIEENVAGVARSRLYRVDLAMPGPAVPLVPIKSDAGDSLLGFSPGGQSAAIGRLEGDRWRLGIVALRTGAVRWFPIAPDFYWSRTTLGWLSEDELVVSAREDGSAPWLQGDNGQDQANTVALWNRTRSGKEVAVTAVGSGSYLSVTKPPPMMALFKVDVTDGTSTVLARGSFENLAVSPDGRHVALTEQAEAIGVETPGPLSHATDVRRRHLTIVDTQSGHSWKPCPACDLPFFPPVWSASGQHLMFYSREAALGWRNGDVLVVDVKNSTVARPPLGRLKPEITTIQGLVDAPGLGWVGDTPILYANENGAATHADWYALGSTGSRRLSDQVVRPGWSPPDMAGHGLVQQRGSTWRLNDRGARQVGRGLTSVLARPVPIPGNGKSARPSFFGWRALGNGILAVATNAEGPAAIQVPETEGQRLVTSSPERRAVIGTQTDQHGVIDLRIWREGKQAVVAASINRHLADVDAPEPVKLRHKLPDGTLATSWLYLPSRQAASGKPPLLVIEYPTRVFGDTPSIQYSPGYSGTFTSVPTMVGHGYAVLLPSMPNLKASSERPFDFAGQVLSAVDAAVETGQVDGGRLALWGHSYGGYAAAIIASETNRFSAVIAANGLYGLYDMATTFTAFSRLHPDIFQPMISGAGWAESGQPNLGATPWTDPMRYLANNAIQRSIFIQTPMLIIGSDRDIVPIGASEALFSSLYRQGKDAVLLTYWNEQHALSSPANVRDSYLRIFDWLDEHFAARRKQAVQGTVSSSKRHLLLANDVPSVP